MLVSFTIFGEKKGGKGVICSQDPCVFFSSVYVVLNVVVYLGGFCSCKKHKHQWHVNHIANRAECIPLLCPDRPHALNIVYKISNVFPFHVSPLFFFNGLSPAFVFTSIIISHLFDPQRLEMVTADTTDRRLLLPQPVVHRCTGQ